MEELQGVWNVVALEVEGVTMAEGAFRGTGIELKGDAFRALGMGSEYGGTFTVDTSRMPHTLDVTFTTGRHVGLKSLGIYTLKAGTWTLCLGMAGRERPTEFVTTPGSGHALETLTRAPVASAADEPAAAPAPSAAASSDALAAHQGEWAPVSIDQGGKPMIPVAFLSMAKRIVRGNEFSVTAGGQVILAGTFTINAATSPRQMDYVLTSGSAKGKTQLGIYELTGDTARFCMGAPGDPRPAEFVTTTADARTLSVWKKLA